MTRVLLRSGELDVTVDPAYGCEITDILHRPTATPLLLSTPTRAQAEEVRTGRAEPEGTDSHSRWLERYVGGWQVLVPHAGPEVVRDGRTLGFHGEGSAVPWRTREVAPDALVADVRLSSAPLRITREITVRDAVVTMTDVLENLSSASTGVDYVSHVAFGGGLVADSVDVEAGAERPERIPAGCGPGSYDSVPVEPRAWAALTSVAAGLRVRLDWDGTLLPHVWRWRELGGTAAWPWLGMTRTVALEPASRAADAPARAGSIPIGPGGSVMIAVVLTVESLRDQTMTRSSATKR